MFHIADAPAHGKDYCVGWDRYPDGDPDGHDLVDLMKEFKKNDIQYNFIKINESTDKMEKAMSKIYPEL